MNLPAAVIVPIKDAHSDNGRQSATYSLALTAPPSEMTLILLAFRWGSK